MPASQYVKTKVTDFLLRATTFTMPTTVYVSLHTANPTDSGTANGTEVSGSWYVRQPVTFAAQSTPGVTSNSNTITYPAVTGAPVTVTHFALWDAATLGNMLEFGTLSASKTFAITDVPSWLPNQLQSNMT